ncbi:hypothetical protein O3M35_000847 [Rhynocoris fuscipes]|uniref:Uncharacterized protein n=1 Tax=Rhynocoris fuscipes TaxID=488301 RepID=A0AAW1DRH2_9HEMI
MSFHGNQRITFYQNFSRGEESLSIVTYNNRMNLPSLFDDIKRFDTDDYNNNEIGPRSQMRYMPIQYPSTVQWYKDYENSINTRNNYNNNNNGYKRSNFNKNNYKRKNNKRNKPYECNKFCNDEKARSIAKRLTDVDQVNDAINDLCSLMDVKNKQPLYAVIHELLIMEKEKQIENLRDYSDKSTQTPHVRTIRPSLKREYCTPIQERSENNLQTPASRVFVKLEKITPISQPSGFQ